MKLPLDAPARHDCYFCTLPVDEYVVTGSGRYTSTSIVCGCCGAIGPNARDISDAIDRWNGYFSAGATEITGGVRSEIEKRG